MPVHDAPMITMRRNPVCRNGDECFVEIVNVLSSSSGITDGRASAAATGTLIPVIPSALIPGGLRAMVSVSESFFNCPATLYYPDSRQVAKFRWCCICAVSAGISMILIRGDPPEIPAGIELRELPGNFQCCECYASKDEFCKDG